MTSPTKTILTATGDLMFYGAVAEGMRRSGDPLHPLRPLAEALTAGDVLFGNFETPISAERRNEPDAPDRYFAPPGMGQALKAFGYDVMNLANNHVYDFGVEGVERTIAELRGAGLAYMGIGRDFDAAAAPAVVTAGNGVRLGFLGYTTANTAVHRRHEYVACFPSPERVGRDVRRLKRDVDVVVVSCHTGAQFNPYPSPETRKLARLAVEAGASCFLAHHPHVPEGIERIGDGLAVYSLGDFVAPIHSEPSRRTMFVRIHLAGDVVSDCEVVPCYITDDGRTVLATGEMREEIAAHVDEISRAIAEGRSDDLHFERLGGRFVEQFVKSWIDELRTRGPEYIVRKFRTLRPYHLQLIWKTLSGKVMKRFGIGGKR